MRRPPDDAPTLFESLPGLPVPADFESFWARYPNKQGKALARKDWAKLSATDRVEAAEALAIWCEFWRLAHTEQRFIPHGSTWVHQRRWEDDIPDLPQRTISAPPAWTGIDEYVKLANAQAHPMRQLGR